MALWQRIDTIRSHMTPTRQKHDGPPFGRAQKALTIIGAGFVAAALVCNPRVLAALFSSDGALEQSSITKIWTLQIVCFVLGSLAFGLRKSAPRFLAVRAAPALIGFLRRHPRIGALGFGCILTVGTVSIGEIVLGEVNERRLEKQAIKGGNFLHIASPDPVFGYRPNPSAHHRLHLRKGANVIYDVEFDIDDKFRRVVNATQQDRAGPPVLFFGCSFMFGHGLEDEETLPAIVGRLAPEIMPYNYAFSGYGPQQLLAHLQSPGIVDDVQDGEPEGGDPIAIYGYIDDHVDRVIGSLRVYKTWGGDFAHYRISGDGELERIGTFRDSRPIRSSLYSLLGRSEIATFTNSDFPLRISDCDIELTCKIIEEARDTFERRFGSDQFYVMIYPGAHLITHGESPLTGRVIERLRNSGVKVLDYTELLDPLDDGYRIKGDDHPTGLQNEAIAVQLIKDLGIGGQEVKN